MALPAQQYLSKKSRYADMKNLIGLASLLAIFLSSCKKEHEPEICTGKRNKALISVAFAGCTKGELDTVITKVYSKGSNFRQPIDIVIVTDTNMTVREDTMLRVHNKETYLYNGFASLKPMYDYIIELPSANRSYHIADITFPVDSVFTYGAGMHGCDQNGPNFMFCSGLQVDNRPVTPVITYISPLPISMLYLTR